MNVRRKPNRRSNLLATLIPSVILAALFSAAAGFVEYAKATQQDPPAKQEKEPSISVTGVIVNQRGLPVKDHAVELYMIVDGIVRDAFGTPIKSALTIGPDRQIVGLMMFPVQSKTDAAGKFSLELPNYMMLPAGVQMTGWTVVGIDANRKVLLMKTRGEMVSLPVKPDANVTLGKVTLSEAPAAQ